MLVDRARTCWPALRYGAPAHQRVEPLEAEHTKTGAGVHAVSRDEPGTHVTAPPAQAAPANEQATTPAGREDMRTEDQAGAGAAIPRDPPCAIYTVAEVLAMAAMHNAAAVAPPPPAHPTGASAATAAPMKTTFYTAATSAAQEALNEAQLACGVRPFDLAALELTQVQYDDPSSDSDGEADGAGSDADKEDAGIYDPHVSSPAGHYWTYASPYAAAHVDVGDFAGAALESGGFPLRPAVWTDVDGASTDNDALMSSEEE